MNPSNWFLWTIAAGCCLPTVAARAATIRVPEDHPTILAGMDAAAVGDTVLVGPGTWTAAETRLVVLGGLAWEIRSLCFAKSGTSVISTHGRDETVLDLQGEGWFSTGILAANTVETVLVEGFTFTGRSAASEYGACVEGLTLAGLEVRNCRFEGNASASSWAPAISTSGPTVVENCEFFGNSAQDYDAGIVYSEDTDLTVRGCLFADNRGTAVYSATNLLVTHTLVESSVFRQTGFNISIIGFVHLMEVRDCLFEGGFDGSVLAGNYDTVIERCTFLDETDPIFVDYGDAQISRCTFVSCGGYGSCVAAAADADVDVSSSIFAYSEGGEALRGNNGSLVSECNIFWENSGGNFRDVVPGPHDLPADPQFCDLENLDLTIRSTSPCAPENSGPCGQIGAWEVGCGPVSVESRSWGSIKSLYR